jgi:hypothetical protein
MPSIAEAEAKIQASGLPVLFADTCILLDVIRAPLRPADLPVCVEAAFELLQKDSTIVEECLEVSRQLQAAGFSPKRVFCTSNRNDYCEKGSRLHSTLAADFGAAGLGFATSLPWAVNEIKNP